MPLSDEETVVDEAVPERTTDGGAPSGAGGAETNGDINMGEPNGIIEDIGPKKVKRKFLDRRARKNLPSKEEIARMRYAIHKFKYLSSELVGGRFEGKSTVGITHSLVFFLLIFFWNVQWIFQGS